jgi:hypothetical protein
MFVSGKCVAYMVGYAVNLLHSNNLACNAA